MNGLRKLAFVLMAMMLAAFALPALADKVYQVTLCPGSVQAAATNLQPAQCSSSSLALGGTGQLVSMQLNNISSDTGNANTSSFKLSAPSGFTIQQVYTVTRGQTKNTVAVGGGYTATIQVLSDGSGVWVSNIQVPLKPFGTALQLNNMKVDVSCSPQTTWVLPGVWTGSGFSGQTFTLNTTQYPKFPSTRDTPVTGSCGSLSFFNQPADAFIGSVITTVPFNSTGARVQVQAMQNANPVSGVSVSIGSTGGTCSISGSATTDLTGTATLTSISSSAIGTDCQLTASATGFTGATSNQFDVVQNQGVLSCDPNDPNNHAGNLDPDAVPPLGGPDWGLKRGLNADVNATCGANVPFTLVVDGNTNTAHFTEDSLGQATSVEYIIRWKTVAVDGDKWSAKQPCVSWGVPNPNYGEDLNGICVGDFVPALACVSNNVSGGTAVMPAVPNSYPFNDSVEGAYLQYQPGTPAKVCIAQQGWTSDGSVPGVQYWHKFIDQADTGIRLP